MRRIAIAQDTLEILEAGYYYSPEGKQVDIGQGLVSCLAQTKYYEPDTLSTIKQNVLSSSPQFSNIEFEVRNETTLMGAERITQSQNFQKIAVLNFASAKNPGGGFLKGAQAQEESLARSSALYKSLLKCPEYYDFHRSQRSLLYSDRIIYSPDCPIFRKDDGTLLEKPFLVDFITSPAPNAGAIWRNQPKDAEKIPEVLYSRGAKLLSLAVYYGCDALVLGAWGCGVFKNEPSMVAQMFADFLLPNGQFWGRFRSVLFSVLDSSKESRIFGEFQSRFSSEK
ncbi:TIGR02452 family protein [Trichocoleus sp. ST-U3]|uniref:TIGR02452 family protein n=1 Tax=Coleofasciculus sp. FACHB-542 TaxID=2692787 RepID=UPI0016821E06|nr:TIGR02452 family protein [Coleofasciculus sp. FACHB-542]MBD2085958.1 TIGR02452 family protein [Coleofasciculus sp. FACHB-542]